MKDPITPNIDVDIDVEDIDSDDNEFSPDIDSHPASGNQNVLTLKKLTTNITEETKASTLKTMQTHVCKPPPDCKEHDNKLECFDDEHMDDDCC